MVNAFAVVKKTPRSCTVMSMCPDETAALQSRIDLCNALSLPSNAVSIEKIFEYNGEFFHNRELKSFVSKDINLSDFT